MREIVTLMGRFCNVFDIINLKIYKIEIIKKKETFVDYKIVEGDRLEEVRRTVHSHIIRL